MPASGPRPVERRWATRRNVTGADGASATGAPATSAPVDHASRTGWGGTVRQPPRSHGLFSLAVMEPWEGGAAGGRLSRQPHSRATGRTRACSVRPAGPMPAAIRGRFEGRVELSVDRNAGKVGRGLPRRAVRDDSPGDSGEDILAGECLERGEGVRCPCM